MRPWYERDPQRHAAERSFWLDNDFAEDHRGGKVGFTGTVEIVVGEAGGPPQRDAVKLRVEYPPGFPYRPPDVEFIEPRIRRSSHQSPLGAPCLFPPRAWNQFVPASEVHDAIRRWLRGWKTDSFPRELDIYELPEYFLPSALTVLVPTQAFARFAAAERGRFSVTRAAGRDLAVLRTVDKQAVAQDLLDGLGMGEEVRQETANGRWFRLHEQPPALRYTSELSRVLAQSGHQFQPDRRPTKHGLIGLVFSDAVLREERLLVLDYSAPNDRAQPAAQGWPLRAPWSYVVSPSELFKRLQGIRDVDPLLDSNVLMLGLGAVGSGLALDLAREGVGGFVLCDPDRLRPGNVMRHSLDLFSSGQLKALAMERAIGRVDPYGETWPQTENLDDPEVLSNLMRSDHPLYGVDLVVSAIGDEEIESLVSAVALGDNTPPVLFVRTLHNGDLIRIILLRPGRDPCFECLRLWAEEGHPDLIDPPETELPPVFDAGCATAADPAAGLASRLAAVFGARRALEVLLDEDDDTNHWLWVDRAIPAAPDPRLHQAQVMHAVHLPRNRRCEICP